MGVALLMVVAMVMVAMMAVLTLAPTEPEGSPQGIISNAESAQLV